MLRKNIKEADFMLNIDISYMREVLVNDYLRTKKFLNNYIVFMVSEQLKILAVKSNIANEVKRSISIDDIESDILLNEYCSNNSQFVFEKSFNSLIIHSEYMDFISYTSLHIEKFIQKIVGRIAINLDYYYNKVVIINVAIVSVNLISLTTKVINNV